MQSEYTPWLSTDALHCRTHELADPGMLYLKHYPLLGEVSLGDPLNISVTVKALSGADLVTDSLLVFFRINHGEWWHSTLQNVANDEYTFSFTSVNYAYLPGDTVEYYIYAKDESGRSEKYPYIGAADPFMFHFGGVGIEDMDPLQVRVWPNPADDFVTVTSDQIQRVEIYNMMGQLVFEQNYNDSHIVIPTSNMAPGTYAVKVTATNGTVTKQVIVR